MTEKDLLLLHDARLLLRAAFDDSGVSHSPLTGSKVSKALVEIENALEADETPVSTAAHIFPVLLDRARYAMQLMWFYSDVSRHPSLAAPFDDGLRLVEARMLDINASE